MNIELEKEVAYVLKYIGIAQDLLGYEYIKHAVDLILKDRKHIDSVTKELYPELAKKFKATPSRVERAIRHAVESCFNHIDQDIIEFMFGNSISVDKGRPTNTHFLAAIVEAVRFIHVPNSYSDIHNASPSQEVKNNLDNYVRGGK